MWDMQLVFIILFPCTNTKSVSYSNEHSMHVQYTQNCMNSHIQEDVCPLLILSKLQISCGYIVSLATSMILQNKQECTRYEFRHHWDVSCFIIIVFRPALKWIWIPQARILRMPLIRSTSLGLVHETALLIQYLESVTDILFPVPYQWGHAYNYYTLPTVTKFYTVS